MKKDEQVHEIWNTLYTLIFNLGKEAGRNEVIEELENEKDVAPEDEYPEEFEGNCSLAPDRI